MTDLDHVLWIGGPSASGKTTVVSRLARRHGLRWYNSDAMTWNHRDRALQAGSLGAHRWESWRATTPAERPPLSNEDIIEMSLHRERGPMTVEDLRALPAAPMIIAEGTQITPSIVPPTGTAVWLMPSPQTQRRRWEQKHGPDGWPGWALAIRERIQQQVQAAGAKVLVVDDLNPDQTLQAVEEIFRNALEAGPTATTTADRQALLRYIKHTMLAQSRAFLARPWANDEASMLTRSFVCECGDPDCEATVNLAIDAFPEAAPAGDERLLSPHHRSAEHE